MSSSSRKMLQAAAGNAGGDFYPYTVDYSARFNDDGDAKMYRTHSTPTSDQKFTYSTWFKHCNVSTNAGVMFYVRNSAWNRYFAIFAYPPSGGYNGTIYISCNPNGTIQDVAPSALFRDFSAWYHLVLAVDSTESTATDRVKVYINGERVTDWISGTAPNNVTLNQSITALQSGGITAIGGRDDVAYVQMYDGYLSQTAYIDGTAYAATDFGESKNGVWIPKDISGLSFGNNGYYLDYASSSALGNDVSGNNNDLTTSGLTSTDQMIDTPTNNFMTAPVLYYRTPTYSPSLKPTMREGNLQIYTDNSQGMQSQGFPQSGKWYFECTTRNSYPLTSYGTYYGVSVAPPSSTDYQTAADALNQLVYYTYDNYGAGSTDRFVHNGVWNTTANVSGASGSLLNGDILAFAIDMDNGVIDSYVNNVKDHTYTLSASEFAPKDVRLVFGGDGGTIGDINFGQNGDFNGFKTAQGNSDENGIGDFYYTPPSGYLAVCSKNMPEPAIGPNSAENVTDYFNVVLYTGNGTAIGSGGNAITGVGFQPDKVAIKNRDAADSWMVFDDVRGATNYVEYDSADAEATDTESLTSFDSDGFTLGNNVAVNTNGEDYVAYCWRENADFFDIVTFTAAGTASQTVSHNLDVAPDFFTLRSLDTLQNWNAYCSFLPVAAPEDYVIQLSTDGAIVDTDTRWNDTAPTSTQITLGTTYNNTDDHVMYLWANHEGMCKVGFYTGNGSATDGPYIYTGFRPAFVMVKRTDSTGNWVIGDTTREPYNSDAASSTDFSYADIPNAPNLTTILFDYLSNGFKLRTSGGNTNGSGGSYIYMAFAEVPFKYSNAR